MKQILWIIQTATTVIVILSQLRVKLIIRWYWFERNDSSLNHFSHKELLTRNDIDRNQTGAHQVWMTFRANNLNASWIFWLGSLLAETSGSAFRNSSLYMSPTSKGTCPFSVTSLSKNIDRVNAQGRSLPISQPPWYRLVFLHRR